MKSISISFRFSLLVLSFLIALAMQATASDYKPELFKKTKLVFEDSFDGKISKEAWEVRQSSTWKIVNGVLTGSQSSKEFQAKKIAQGDKAHVGFKPVMWLKTVPAEFVVTMRLRYDAEKYHPRFPLLDLGHHVHTVTFGKDSTTVRLMKDKELIKIDEPLLPLGKWLNVAVELKKGTLLLNFDGKKHVIKSDYIDMGDQRQIDFKGVDLGTCQIDDVKVWQGIE